jgi:hypothetical protein
LEPLAEKVKHPEATEERKHKLAEITTDHKNSANAVNAEQVVS